MTIFEIIIITIIYLFCYGFMLATFIKDKNEWFRIFWIFASAVLAIYAPMIIGGMLFEMLNKSEDKS